VCQQKPLFFAASIIATAGGQESYDHLVNAMGIAGDHIIRYREINLEQIKNHVRELTDGRGVSVSFQRAPF